MAGGFHVAELRTKIFPVNNSRIYNSLHTPVRKPILFRSSGFHLRLVPKVSTNIGTRAFSVAERIL